MSYLISGISHLKSQCLHSLKYQKLHISMQKIYTGVSCGWVQRWVTIKWKMEEEGGVHSRNARELPKVSSQSPEVINFYFSLKEMCSQVTEGGLTGCFIQCGINKANISRPCWYCAAWHLIMDKEEVKFREKITFLGKTCSSKRYSVYPNTDLFSIKLPTFPKPVGSVSSHLFYIFIY